MTSDPHLHGASVDTLYGASTGTVTFLFTDIEGSTQPAQQGVFSDQR